MFSIGQTDIIEHDENLIRMKAEAKYEAWYSKMGVIPHYALDSRKRRKLLTELGVPIPDSLR